MVFTKQVGELDRLKGLMDDEAINVFRNIFGQCNAALEHNGSLTLDELHVTEIGGPGIGTPGLVLEPGWDPVDETAPIQPLIPPVPPITPDPDEPPFDIEAPSQPNGDPNMQPGDVIWYITIIINETTGATSNIIISDVIDLPIGSIIMTTSTEVPPGWTLFTTLDGRFPVGFKIGDANFGLYGDTGGDIEHGHPNHVISSANINDHGPWSGDTSLEELNFTSDATGDVDTDGINESPLPRVNTEEITVDLDDHEAHSHGATPGTKNVEAGTGANVGDGQGFTTDEETLTHTSSSGGDHDHEIADHEHSIDMSVLQSKINIGVTPQSHKHTWDFPVVVHIGSLPHEMAEHIPPFYVAKFIQRTH